MKSAEVPAGSAPVREIGHNGRMIRYGLRIAPLLLFAAACSSTSSSEDFSTADYPATPAAVGDQVREFLHTQWFKTRYENEEKTRMTAWLYLRNPTANTTLELTFLPSPAGAGLTRVTVTGSSPGGAGTVRQWQMRVHRNLRPVFGTPD